MTFILSLTLNANGCLKETVYKNNCLSVSSQINSLRWDEQSNISFLFCFVLWYLIQTQLSKNYLSYVKLFHLNDPINS